ncbi:MAG TPA: CAP domain-containing protein [Pseudobacteroides sp.]|uniref:CAP domain-containing protein n=1 Tax=Pseudobacteroides sp. TaxID=1968840 RepID=UPI002F9511AE
MKRKIVFLVVFTIICSCIMGYSGANAQTGSYGTIQNVNITNATVTAEYLNVRQGPSTSHQIVCVLKKGQTVKIFGKYGDWYAVYEPVKGCVGMANKSFLKVAGNGTLTPATPKWTKAPVSTPKPSAVAPTPKPSVVIPSPKPSIAPTPVITGPSPTGTTSEEEALLSLINKARSDAGLGPLKFDMQLVKVARLKAQDMVDKNYFSHDSPTYGSPFDMMRQFGVSFKYAGENIAGNSTIEGAFKAWMNSPGHKANILKADFNYNGIGIVSSPTYGKVLVQMFIGR